MNKLYIRIKTEDQLKAVLEWKKADALILDSKFADSALLPEVLKEYSSINNQELYFSLPDIAREERMESIEKIYSKCKELGGFMIKSLDELGLLVEKDFKGHVIGDAFLYTYNSEAAAFYQDFFQDIRFVCSDELTDRELSDTVSACKQTGKHMDTEFIYKIYGYQQLMISNQCISHNYTSCSEKLIKFRDEKGNEFYAESNCSQCYSIVYNGKCTYMLDKMEEIPYSSILIDFTIENIGETKALLKKAGDVINGLHVEKQDTVTRGHHYRGVD